MKDDYYFAYQIKAAVQLYEKKEETSRKMLKHYTS